MVASGSLSKQEIDAVQSYIKALQQCVGGKLVDAFVFGSKARGEAQPDSDVDVMVILDHPTIDDLSEARGLAFDIWLAYQVFLSIRAMSYQQWQALAALQSLFYRNALQDAIPLLPLVA
jgi:predicted nucleotidyltransferase